MLSHSSRFGVVVVTTALCLSACGQQRTALDYAYECEAALGPLPEFNYADAIEIPTTKDGLPLTNASDNARDCDQPFAFNTPCDPGNRMGRYDGVNDDGTPNPDVAL